MLDDINIKAGFRWTGYTKDNILRKLMLGAIVYHDALKDVQWEDLTLKEAQSLAPDVKKHVLDNFPSSYSAAEASAMITGRQNQAMLLSMWACLFYEVERLWPNNKNDVIKTLQSPECERFISKFKAKNDGAPPCSVVLMRELMVT